MTPVFPRVLIIVAHDVDDLVSNTDLQPGKTAK